MSLTMALQSAITGLMTSQKAIDTTANNIANVNTAGYTKKTHLQESLIVGGYSQGVKDLLNVRTVDESLVRDLLREAGIANTLSVLDSYASRIQDLFGEPSANDSLSHTISELQASLETLATDAQSYSSQAEFVNNLEATFSKINKIADYIQNLRLEADREIQDHVTEINSILTQIDKLNEQIMRTDVVGIYSSDDLKDQRDLLLGQLSELMNVQYFTRETGELVIWTSTGEMLVDAKAHLLSTTGSSQIAAWNTKSGEDIPGIYLNGKDISSSIKSGQIAGLIDMRDNVIPDIQAQLDELTIQMTDAMNQIHNQGVSYASPSSAMTGTTKFIDAGNQYINISNGEVRIVVFDNLGNAVASTALVSELGFSEGILYNSSTHPAPVADSLASAIQNWLTTSPDGPQLPQAKVGVDSDGHFFIDLETSQYSIAFRDESSSVLGSDQQDVTIRFDADGDVGSGGIYDREYSGFSNFLGLNDLLIGRDSEWLYDSQILSSNYRTGNTGLATLNFSYEGNMNFFQLEITPGMSIKQIAEAINSDPVANQHLTAEVVSEGGGYRLRIEQIDGKHLEITEPSASGVLDSLGLTASACGLSNIVKLSDNIKNTPSKVSTGTVQFDNTSGKYFISAADNTAIRKMADMFSTNQMFNKAGSMSSGLYNFTGYSSSIVSQVALYYNNNASLLSSQSDLVSSLQLKASDVSGVNLDEELALLIVYERSYNAAAKVITTLDEMMQTLENMI